MSSTDPALSELFTTTIAAMERLSEAERNVPTDQAYHGAAFSDRAERIYNRLCYALRDARGEARNLTRAITVRRRGHRPTPFRYTAWGGRFSDL